MSVFKSFLILCFGILFSTIAMAVPNPASLYCTEQGGDIDLRQDRDGGVYGICIWYQQVGRDPNDKIPWSECEEWALYGGECAKGQCSRIELTYDSNGNSQTNCIPLLELPR